MKAKRTAEQNERVKKKKEEKLAKRFRSKSVQSDDKDKPSKLVRCVFSIESGGVSLFATPLSLV